jgi:hypothetical protein
MKGRGPMSQSQCELGFILFLLILAVWFIFASLRLRKSIITRDVFIENYKMICDDDSVPMHLLESINIVFKAACGYCVCGRLLEMLVFRSIRPDPKLKLELRSMEQQRSFNLAITLRSFVLYISYGASIFGTITRWLFINRQYRTQTVNDNSAEELAEVTDLLSKAKLRWI